MQLLAKFKTILYMGFRATLNFRKLGSFLIPRLQHQLIKSGYIDRSKSKSWNVLETVLSHLKWQQNPVVSVPLLRHLH